MSSRTAGLGIRAWELLVLPTDRRSSRYGFKSLDTMTVFFSRWLPETEIDTMIREAENNFHPRSESTDEETHLQKIQKAEFAIVRRLATRNHSFL